jgi:chemotaxis methyl-accepting protein methylase
MPSANARAQLPSLTRRRTGAEEDRRSAAPRPVTTFPNTSRAPSSAVSNGGWPCTRSKALDSYVRYLQQTPSEVEALFRDLLIGVTNFFRDPEAFAVLENRSFPTLFADQPAGAVIRVWSAGCSTGEEAYSIAILLQEHMEALKQSYTIQVFATDIDSRAIATARSGLYPASIAADLSPQRLARFFTAVPTAAPTESTKVSATCWSSRSRM